MGKEELPYFPGVKTLEAQGYKVYGEVIRALSMPAGAPKEIVAVLVGALERAINNPEHQKKMRDAYMSPRYAGPEGYMAVWDQYEKDVKPLMPLAQTK